jgi:hypothetical protein
MAVPEQGKNDRGLRGCDDDADDSNRIDKTPSLSGPRSVITKEKNTEALASRIRGYRNETTRPKVWVEDDDAL